MEFDDKQRWIRLERRDESGECAIIVCNLGDKAISIPIGEDVSARLVLHGGPDGAQSPVAQIAPDRRNVTLAGAGVAIYLSSG